MPRIWHLLTARRSCRRVLMLVLRKLDTCSSANWIPVPDQTEQRGWDNAGLRLCFIRAGRACKTAPLISQQIYS